MNISQLTVVMTDLRTESTSVQHFQRSPVTFGRSDGNSMRLDALSVSRRHGALLFSRGIIQYVDVDSTNGSLIDGLPIRPNEPTQLRGSSVITVGPFEIVVHQELIALERCPHDPDEITCVSVVRRVPGNPRTSQLRENHAEYRGGYPS